MSENKKVKPGCTFPINGGGEVEVVEYNGWYNVKIKHLGKYGGYVHTVSVDRLRKGTIKNPYYPKLYGVGYVGVGDHARSENQKDTLVYATWRDMLRRVYCEKSLTKHPTYKGCSVVSEWHNFQVFAEWYYKQPNAGRKGFHLDKDLLVYGNKEYGPNTCSFVPSCINALLTDHKASRSKFGQGVYEHGRGYKVHISLSGKKKTVGTYPTIEEARRVYKDVKCLYVKERAEEYKDLLHPKVYENLMKWEFDHG